MKDYYYMLGIEYSATESEIKTAYRKLALKFHPDTNKGDKLYEERFKDIQEAYEILINSEKRFDYDVKFKSSRVTKRDNKYEQEIIKRYGEELRKNEQEIQLKFRTAAQKAAEANEIKRKEDEAKRKVEQEKLLAQQENYKNILLQKENVINNLNEEILKLMEDILKVESELPEIKTIIKDFDLKINALNSPEENENKKEEEYTRIGDLFGGGIIIFADEKGEHGLMCSADDLGKAIWAEAKSVCDNCKAGGYTDWRLPSKEELFLMYKLLHKKHGIKNFSGKNYWSSTKNKEDLAWIFDFHTGDAYDYYNKYNAYFVRAVREF